MPSTVVAWAQRARMPRLAGPFARMAATPEALLRTHPPSRTAWHHSQREGTSRSS